MKSIIVDGQELTFLRRSRFPLWGRRYMQEQFALVDKFLFRITPLLRPDSRRRDELAEALKFMNSEFADYKWDESGPERDGREERSLLNAARRDAIGGEEGGQPQRLRDTDVSYNLTGTIEAALDVVKVQREDRLEERRLAKKRTKRIFKNSDNFENFMLKVFGN